MYVNVYALIDTILDSTSHRTVYAWVWYEFENWFDLNGVIHYAGL